MADRGDAATSGCPQSLDEAAVTGGAADKTPEEERELRQWKVWEPLVFIMLDERYRKPFLEF